MANAYIINFTDNLSDPGNKESFSVQPFTTNGPLKPTDPTLDPNAIDQKAPIVFFGKGVPSFGERFQENILHVLENFAGSVAPVNPTKGMLWYSVAAANATHTELRVYNPAIGTNGSGGDNWESLQFIQATQPDNPITGESWYDPTPTAAEFQTVGAQMMVWDGTAWVSFGANYLPITGGTMTGHISLPTTPGISDATRRDYVDTLTDALDVRITAFEPNGSYEPVYIDGSNNMTANLDMNVFKIVNLATATTSNDAARLADVVPVDGDSNPVFSGMTGFLTLISANPTTAFHATPKTYVDTELTAKVSRTGDTITGALDVQGSLTVGSDPNLPLEVATKSYVDGGLNGKVNTGGDTVTGALDVLGNLTVGSDPILPLQVTPKQYVDTGLGNKLNLSGGTVDSLTVTNNITLNSQPLGPAHATTKQYVDNAIAANSAVANDSYVDNGLMDGSNNTLTLTLTNGQSAVVVTNVAAADHTHFVDQSITAPVTAPTVVYKLNDENANTPFHLNFKDYASGAGDPLRDYPYIPLRSILNYIDTDKAQRTDARLGGDFIELEEQTKLLVGAQPFLSPNVELELGIQATSKQWVEWKTTPDRLITTSGAAQTVFPAPDFIAGGNQLQVYVNGIKKYRNSNGSHLVNFGNLLSLNALTGLANDDTTYTANMLIDGATTASIIIRGRQAQTFDDLVKLMVFGFTIDVINVDPTGDGVFTVIGDWASYFPTGFSFEYETTDGFPDNDGDFTVAAPGASFDGTNTLIPLSPHVAGNPAGTLDGLDPGGRVRVNVAQSWTVFVRDGDLRFESTTEGTTSTIVITDVDLFATLAGFVSLSTQTAGAAYDWYATPSTYTLSGDIATSITLNVAASSGEIVEMTAMSQMPKP